MGRFRACSPGRGLVLGRLGKVGGGGTNHETSVRVPTDEVQMKGQGSKSVSKQEGNGRLGTWDSVLCERPRGKRRLCWPRNARALCWDGIAEVGNEWVVAAAAEGGPIRHRQPRRMPAYVGAASRLSRAVENKAGGPGREGVAASPSAMVVTGVD